jgi:hypothetical protein
MLDEGQPRTIELPMRLLKVCLFLSSERSLMELMMELSESNPKEENHRSPASSTHPVDLAWFER